MFSSQFRAFHAVATYGGFSKAAEKLGLTQPAISDQVRKLEERYGVLLFNRHKRSVFPTELGEQLFELTKRQFEIEQQAVELLSDTKELRRGHLKICADAPLHVMQIIAAFRQNYEGINVTLQIGNSDVVLKRLYDYTADVGVLAHFSDDPRLLSIPLRNDPLVAFVSKDHRWAHLGEIDLASLSDEPLVLREVGSRTRGLVDDEFSRKGLPMNIAMEVEGRESAREAVAAGIGVGIVSQPEFGHDDRLVSLSLTDCENRMYEALVCLKERAHLGVISAFKDIVEAHVKGL
ncbi:LysR substrate-binding domain-containing protein [Flexibacterium corallicola]|uniref:LysR substrate-binding domain-containing protein n=1 Tax=Flexibacterium corallicola TaxID=3037259 RepID=UPI00286F9EB9|nr:LysR substrate-binding domain-containing protein [Pseudovibrio sp. M1P-2-3]